MTNNPSGRIAARPKISSSVSAATIPESRYRETILSELSPEDVVCNDTQNDLTISRLLTVILK